MSAFFFGPAERQLFGYHHPARGTSRGAVVICPSWGGEYQYAHRALRVTARRLADSGLDALTFDYSGTGDSWGHTTDADMDRWRQDVDLAITELQAMSGHARVDLIGLRIGAFVAASASVARRDVERVVLWDPVANGRSWLASFGGAAALPAESQTPVEFGQRLVSPVLLRQFADIEPARYAKPAAGPALLLQTTVDDNNAIDRFGHIADLEHQMVPDATPWLEDTSIWSGLVPTKAVSAVVEWLGRRD